MRKKWLTALLTALLLLASVAVFALKEEPVERFDITPNPMDRECSIILSFRSPISISVQIQTPEGDLIKDIYSGYAAKSMQFTWDRYDMENQYVPEGTYAVVLGYDTRYTSTKKTLILK